MKIRRILATAVAAAVTTPVVFLSAAPAFADTKPSPASTQKPTAGDDTLSTHKELKAAVVKAQAKLDGLKEQREAVEKDLDENNIDPKLKADLAEAQKAVEAAKAAKAEADGKLAEAEKALALPSESDEEKALKEKAVADAQKAVEAAAAEVAAADILFEKADTARDDALVALSREHERLSREIELAEKELADAKKALEDFETIGQECADDKTVKVSLDGPEKITAGTSALFSLRVSNTSQRTLDEVEAYAFAAAMPDSIEDEDFFEEYITVEWSSADVLEWTPLTDDGNAIEVGELLKGGHYDVKLRLTVAPKTPAGPGVVFAMGAYENNDGSCGIGAEPGTAEFDILAAKGDKPKPTPTPSPSTTTPAPVPTTGGTGTTQQGGSSNTPVADGNLAATGSNDALPMIGLGAAGAVALGAGAVFVARRRKAGSQA
ncbi:LAETG motif-containing sortase-dependent surface protein [Streptomyces sp. bgisy095]|uniref:LAETG motif-containing sortase-dependent surface protein n=1 Tax=unclassified Streptomyces TaxID=2593676 RepID=UPI003D75815D